MKILLIMPDARMHKVRLFRYVRSLREAPLSLTALAGLIPDSDIEWRLVDGSVEDIPMDVDADLVGISVITGTACDSYRIADHYRERGAKVVLGGVHVTMLPDEAAEHADAIAVGFAERTWPQIVSDVRAGRLQQVYREEAFHDDLLVGLPPPRRDLQRKNRYMMPNTVYATRGCSRRCDFCSVPVMCPTQIKRPVADIVDEVRAVRSRYLAFNDVSLVDDVEYGKELLTALIPLRKKWGGLATTEVADDPELLELLERSGCSYLLLGFESVNQQVLQDIRKQFNKAAAYRETMTALHSHGISVQGCFVFGFDSDDPSVFRDTVEQVQDMRLDIPRYSIYTPYPGTTLFKRLEEQQRILSYNWDDYDTMHVVYQPKQMTPEELYDGFKWAYRETFRLPAIAKRTAGLSLNHLINGVGNLAYRIFVKRLYNDPRFAKPFTCATA